MIINGNISREELESLGVLDDISGKSKPERPLRTSASPRAAGPETETDSVKMEITESSLEGMKSEGLPDDVLTNLQDLKNKEVTGEEVFLGVLRETIGDEQTDRFKLLILKHVVKSCNLVSGGKRTLGSNVMHHLEETHNKFAASLRVLLTGRLRGFAVDVDVEPVEASDYSSFIEPLQEQQPSYIIVIKMLSGKALLHIDLGLAFTIVDKLLGGKGIPVEEIRPLNPVEVKIMEKIVMQVLEELGEAWETLYPIEPKIEGSHFVPQFVDIGAEPEDTVILISFDIRRETASMGKIQLCIPYATFQPVRQTILSGGIGGKPIEPEIKNNMMRVVVPVRCQLGENTVTLKELLQLKPDDVIMLNQQVGSLAKIVVGKTVRFLGKPGKLAERGKYGVQIISEVQEEIAELEKEQEDGPVGEMTKETPSLRTEEQIQAK